MHTSVYIILLMSGHLLLHTYLHKYTLNEIPQL